MELSMQCGRKCTAFFFGILLTASAVAAPIHDCAQSGDIQGLTRILAEAPNQVNALGTHRFTALVYAVRDHNVELVNLLLSHGARVSLKDGIMGWDALDWTRKCLRECADEYLQGQVEFWKGQKAGDEEIARRIAKHKETHSAENRQKWLEIESRLLEALQKEEAADQASPLFPAVIQGNLEEVRQILDKGSYVDVKDKDGRTPLFLAVMRGYAPIVKLLLERGASMYERDKSGQSPYSCVKEISELFTAIERQSNCRSLQYLVNNGVDIETRDQNGETALMRAAAEGKLEIVECLLGLGARVDVKNTKGETLQDVVCTRAYPADLKERILRVIREREKGAAAEKANGTNDP